jgi:hypothetical protein
LVLAEQPPYPVEPLGAKDVAQSGEIDPRPSSRWPWHDLVAVGIGDHAGASRRIDKLHGGMLANLHDRRCLETEAS